MKHLIYSHLKTVKKQLLVVLEEAPTASGVNSHKWVNLAEHTETIGRYAELIRKLSLPFDVLVVRNPNSRSEGIHVIGKQELVESFSKMLLNIIDKVERVTSKFKKNQYNRKQHFSGAKATFKGKCLMLYIKELNQVNRLIEFNDSYKLRLQLRKDYMKQTPLKIKKAFNAKQAPRNNPKD
jgi:hypothetical protein